MLSDVHNLCLGHTHLTRGRRVRLKIDYFYPRTVQALFSRTKISSAAVVNGVLGYFLVQSNLNGSNIIRNLL